MLVAGDEFGRTQRGNNNAYCQDSEISWLDWAAIDDDERAFLTFVRTMIRLRHEHIVFHRNRFFHGRNIPGTAIKDITWLRPDGEEMSEDEWADGEARAFSFLIRGEAGEYHLTADGQPQPDDSFFVVLNASEETLAWELPSINHHGHWETVVDTDREDESESVTAFADADRITVQPRSLVVLVRRRNRD